MQAAALIRVVRSRAMFSAAARQQVLLARPQPGWERQAQRRDEAASAPEQQVSQQWERPASQQPEPPWREPA